MQQHNDSAHFDQAPARTLNLSGSRRSDADGPLECDDFNALPTTNTLRCMWSLSSSAACVEWPKILSPGPVAGWHRSKRAQCDGKGGPSHLLKWLLWWGGCQQLAKKNSNTRVCWCCSCQLLQVRLMDASAAVSDNLKKTLLHA